MIPQTYGPPARVVALQPTENTPEIATSSQAGGSGAQPLTILDTSTRKSPTTRHRSYLTADGRQSAIVRTYRKAGKTAMADRLADCGRFVKVSSPDCSCKPPEVQPMYCQTPGCQHRRCQRSRILDKKASLWRRISAHRRKARAEPAHAKRCRWRMLTLTTRSGRSAGQGVSIEELRKNAVWAWRMWTKYRAETVDKLRLGDKQAKFAAVRYGNPLTGGFASLEYGRNGMVHLHVLVYSPFRPAEWWRDPWEKLTGASQVQIKEIYASKRRPESSALSSAATEAIKYLCKPARTAGELAVTANASVGTYAMRNLRAFGSVHGGAPAAAQPCCPVCGCSDYRHSSPIPGVDALAIDKAAAQLARLARNGSELALDRTAAPRPPPGRRRLDGSWTPV